MTCINFLASIHPPCSLKNLTLPTAPRRFCKCRNRDQAGTAQWQRRADDQRTPGCSTSRSPARTPLHVRTSKANQKGCWELSMISRGEVDKNASSVEVNSLPSPSTSHKPYSDFLNVIRPTKQLISSIVYLPTDTLTHLTLDALHHGWPHSPV